jgi:hypothetical protein
MPALTIAARFCGPPGAANGGYLAGRVAALAGSTVRVRLQAPVPLERELHLDEVPDGLELRDAGRLLATATPTRLELRVPRAPDYVGALSASRRFVFREHHAFPECFVCGDGRARGDGMRVFAGPTEDGTMVAAPWAPDVSLDRGDGKVAPEFMWAALDCPGYFAARSDGVPMLLGECTAHLDRLVHVGEPCVVIGWRIAVSGRKYEVGTALFDEDGEPCGRAKAVWIEPREGVPVALGAPRLAPRA